VSLAAGWRPGFRAAAAAALCADLARAPAGAEVLRAVLGRARGALKERDGTQSAPTAAVAADRCHSVA
jgi:hypothetical protein